MESRVAVAALMGVALSGCTGSGPGPVAAVPPQTAPVQPGRATPAGPVLGPDGRCTGAPPAVAAAIEPGIGECDLVRLKGKPPTDVLVGESGKGQREVQVLYAEPGGRELYFFVDNRLDRVVR
jgi:hypothetical protein